MGYEISLTKEKTMQIKKENKINGFVIFN